MWQRIVLVRCSILIVTVITVLGLSLGTSGGPGQVQQPDLEGLAGWPVQPGDPMHGVNYSMLDLSLRVREQVDFLITPALLVQEAISEDVVLTYPEE